MTHDINIKKWKVLLFLFWSLTFDWYQHVTSSSWNLSKFRNHNSHRLTWMCSNREKNRFIFNKWIVFLQEMMILWFLFWPSLQSLFCHPLEQLQTYDPRVFIHVPLFKHGNKSHSSRSTEKEKRIVVKVQLLFLIQMGLKFSFIQKKKFTDFTIVSLPTFLAITIIWSVVIHTSSIVLARKMYITLIYICERINKAIIIWKSQ